MQGLHDSVRLRLQACRTLPTLPTVALQILDLCQQPEASVGDVAALIQQDPALTSKVLRVVNSPLYGLNTKVATINHATALLGLNAVRSIALSFSLVRGLRQTQGRRFDHQRYWQRTVHAGVSARVLAKALHLPEEELFLASLLQDIGMLALAEALPDYGELVAGAKGDHLTLAGEEKQAYGADHATISGWLLGKWNLPELYQQAAALSHDPTTAPVDSRHRREVAAVALASWVGDIWSAPDPPAVSLAARERAEAWLSIGDEQFGMVMENVAEALPETAALFEVDLGSPETIHNILMEAKEALLVIGMSAASAPRPIPTAAPTLAAGEGTTCDPLTGLFKRVHLEERLAAEFEQATQNRTPLSLIFADVDHLKQVNDLWGMEIGDHVMLALAHALAREGGGREHVARYGDHEMVLVLPRVKAAEAAAMAERIRQASATREYPIDEGQTMHISVSLGYATHLDATAFASAGELLEAARYALQSAKREGRNRVMAFTAPAFAPGTTRTRP
jgi:diguanylate cyclase (GGDEF)-like protein